MNPEQDLHPPQDQKRQLMSIDDALPRDTLTYLVCLVDDDTPIDIHRRQMLLFSVHPSGLLPL